MSFTNTHIPIWFLFLFRRFSHFFDHQLRDRPLPPFQPTSKNSLKLPFILVIKLLNFFSRALPFFDLGTICAVTHIAYFNDSQRLTRPSSMSSVSKRTIFLPQWLRGGAELL